MTWVERQVVDHTSCNDCGAKTGEWCTEPYRRSLVDWIRQRSRPPTKPRLRLHPNRVLKAADLRLIPLAMDFADDGD